MIPHRQFEVDPQYLHRNGAMKVKYCLIIHHSSAVFKSNRNRFFRNMPIAWMLRLAMNMTIKLSTVSGLTIETRGLE